MNLLIEEIDKTHMKEEINTDFQVGDNLDVHVRIVEGEKERIQIFKGVCIARNGGGVNEYFTVRRLVGSEGVERIFPLHSPRIAKIDIARRGRTQRAKLYYLRDRIGKRAILREETRPSRVRGFEKKKN
ncbi:MAG: 50S ribosomal protein L19 [Planctomycetota bacterium]